ncbi:MAG: hypothetical protein OEY25_13190 [Candidatus Aminicenantes bacterium]|nr:hypothetical protein [Candidatus Aminicenantes bacterium]MDH5704954.1 hypothetical protein [Candidatus Aminicenantes bacterium]
MNALVILGLVLAFINPVIGGVLVGYIVWLKNPTAGFQLIVLSFTVMSIFVIGFIIWTQKKIKKIEKRIKAIEGKD